MNEAAKNNKATLDELQALYERCPCHNCQYGLRAVEQHRKYGLNDYELGYAIDPRVTAIGNGDHTYGTQKARGIAALARLTVRIPASQAERKVLIIQHPSQVNSYSISLWSQAGATMMLRPAPKVPAHGFVESRPYTIQNLDDFRAELLKVFHEAREKDPDAELIVMPFVKAEHSAVYVPESGVLSVGEKHDGVTAGKKAITLPVPSTTITNIDYWGHSRSHIAEGEHAYFELVLSPPYTNDGSPTAEPIYLNTPIQGKKLIDILENWDLYQRSTVVQVRSGPQQPSLSEYIPKKFKIKELVAIGNEPLDLLEWKDQVQELATRTGVAVWAPGAALASHEAVHCIANKVPFLTRTEEPKVGDTILPPKLKEFDFDIHEFELGLALVANVNSMKGSLDMAIATIHCLGTLVYFEKWSRMLGFAVGMFFKAAAMACMGEARHMSDQGYMLSGSKKPRRSVRWSELIRLELPTLAATLAQTAEKFAWDAWESSYGGKPWLHSTVTALKFYDVLSTKDRKAIIEAANDLLHCQHNGGWLFNKFTADSIMAQAAAAPGAVMASAMESVFQVVTFDQPEILPEGDPVTKRTTRFAESLKLDSITRYPDGEFIMRVNGRAWTSMDSKHIKLIKDLIAYV
jgi:hypothetical protein